MLSPIRHLVPSMPMGTLRRGSCPFGRCYRGAGLLFLLALCHCLTVTTVNIGSKTSLERQLMGELESWEAEELSSLAVRATTSSPSDRLHIQDSLLLHTRARQVFRRDDVADLLRAGCVGESYGGQLVARPCTLPLAPSLAALQDQLIREENTDRWTLLQLLQQQRPQFQHTSLQQLGQLYGQLLRAAPVLGAWYQDAREQWHPYVAPVAQAGHDSGAQPIDGHGASTGGNPQALGQSLLPQGQSLPAEDGNTLPRLLPPQTPGQEGTVRP